MKLPPFKAYKLNQDGSYRLCTNEDECTQTFINDRKIAVTTLTGNNNNKTTVSTIFLPLDHSFSDKGPPVLFETLIFDGPLEDTMWRCNYLEEAFTQHTKAVHKCRCGEWNHYKITSTWTRNFTPKKKYTPSGIGAKLRQGI